MKTFNKNSLVTLVAVSFTLCLAGPVAALAATTPTLGTASTFGILSSTFTNSNTAPQTVINGSVCYTTGPSTVPLAISGATVTPCDPATGIDQGSALSNLNGQACTNLGAGPIALDAVVIGVNPPGTFPPGCYSTAGAMNITLSTTVTLNGPGTYIFRSGGALTTGANSQVVLANGASASNVFWAPVAATTIGANAAPTSASTFVGNILDAAGISLGHFANLLGRALAFGGTVTTDANTITVPPATLHVVKLVVNGNGGTAVASNFNLHVKNGGVEVAGSPAPGVSAPGTPYSVNPGTYTISEDTNASYVQSFTGDCNSSGSVTLSTGDDKICTVVNTDIPAPTLVAPSATVNAGGRIVPLIGVIKVPTPLALPGGSGSVTYNYTAWNVGGQQALTNVTVTDDSCSPVVFLSGDLNNNGKLDPHENWKYSCTTTLTKTTTNTATAIGHSDDGFNQATIATAIATVVVGVPTTPPLINVVKVPSQLTPLPFGGGNVTYTYTVTNPGVVAMHNVILADDKCGPVSSPSGDVNGNNLLDPGETWTYTCQANVTSSTRNVATATGKANGFTAIGYAFATVLVSAPGLPNTGFPPESNSTPFNILIVALILMALSASAVVAIKIRRI